MILECGDPAAAAPLSKRGHVRVLQIPSQTWDGAVPQTDSPEIFCGLLKKLSSSFSAYYGVLFRVGTNIAVTMSSRQKGNMKPISAIVGKSNRFPPIDCNYRPMTLDGYRGRCIRTRTPHFQNISSEYFQNEARHDFLVEAVCFVLIIFTAAAPLVIAAHAVADLCRAFAQI